MELDKERALFRHIHRLEEALIPRVSEKATYREGRYPCIHMGPDSFIKMVTRAKSLFDNLYNLRYDSPFPPKFLDVGCGIGARISLAQVLGFEGYGLEINPTYYKVAIHRLRLPKNRIFNVDARAFDNYKMFNIIYFYCPMADHRLQLELEEAVYQGAREGAILIQCLKQNHERDKEPLLHRLSMNIYLKSSDPVLIKKAEEFFEKE